MTALRRQHRGVLWLALLPVATSVGGCGPGAGASRADVVSPGGVPIWDVLLSREYAVAGELGLGVTPIQDIGVDTNGNLYIPARGGTTIGVVDGATGVVREWGRAGDGPGEFRGLTATGVTGDGQVWAWDARLRRISLFSIDGAFLESWPVRTSLEAGVLTNGQWIEVESRLTEAGAFDYEVVGYTTGGGALTIAAMHDAPVPAIQVEYGGGVLQLDRPWVPRLFRDFNSGGDGFVMVYPEAPANGSPAQVDFVVVGADGVVSSKLEFGPVASTSGLVDDYVNFVIEWSNRPFLTREVLEEALPVPTWLPGVRGVAYGADGIVWVRMPGLTADNEWMAIDPLGGGQGLVRLPPLADLLHADEQFMWIVTPDSFGSPVFTQFSIRR